MNVAPAPNPGQQQVPPVLYKYVTANRLDVLANCRLRFSQRTVFEDDRELQPDYKAFGTVEEIERHIRRTAGAVPGAGALARAIAADPKHQERAIQAAVRNIKSIDDLGILCLTENGNSERMWNEYAANGAGFVVAFDTTHVGFAELTAPMGIRPVSYSDVGFATFLGMMENSPFEPLYRKRMDYSFEQEWRSIRLLKNLERGPARFPLVL